VSLVMPAALSVMPKGLCGFRFWNEESNHELEAGVVVVNLKLRFPGMLSVLKLNNNPERDDLLESKW
jgi:hypothetical protein